MTISHTQKIIFIHVQRTGGSTIINLLKEQLGFDVEVIAQHGNALSSENALLEKYTDYFSFGFVRNPWDRMLSWYSLIHKWDPQDIEKERQRFEKFLELDVAIEGEANNSFHYNQLDYFPALNDSLDSVKIYSYEKYEEEVNQLFKQIGLSLGEIPIINNTNKKNYRDYYTERSKELVRRKCHKDIEYFKYSF